MTIATEKVGGATRVRIDDTLILTLEADGGLSLEALKLPANATLHPATAHMVFKELGLIRRADVLSKLQEVL